METNETTNDAKTKRRIDRYVAIVIDDANDDDTTLYDDVIETIDRDDSIDRTLVVDDYVRDAIRERTSSTTYDTNVANDLRDIASRIDNAIRERIANVDDNERIAFASTNNILNKRVRDALRSIVASTLSIYESASIAYNDVRVSFVSINDTSSIDAIERIASTLRTIDNEYDDVTS